MSKEETVISAAQLLELRSFICSSLDECDNTHRLTIQWLTERGIPFEGETREAIADCGGCCCDCEIGWNFPDTVEEIEQRLKYGRKKRLKRAR